MGGVVKQCNYTYAWNILEHARPRPTCIPMTAYIKNMSKISSVTYGKACRKKITRPKNKGEKTFAFKTAANN